MFEKFGVLLHDFFDVVCSVCAFKSWPSVWPGGHAMLHRAGMKSGGKWHTYTSLGSKARANLAMCISLRGCVVQRVALLSMNEMHSELLCCFGDDASPMHAPSHCLQTAR